MHQTPLAFDPHLADSLTGFDIGWDHAHHGLVPPPEHLFDGNPVRQGWQAGKACFGAHTLGASRRVRQWLQLRLRAWQRGIAFELAQVTPHYLGQIEVALCPITRQRLGNTQATVDRVCDHAGYAAGNLAMISIVAHRAKGGITWDEALVNAQRAEGARADSREGGDGGRVAGLDAVAWSRLAVLISFVTPLAHAQASRLPLLLQPPNRLRLLNPVQGLQALVTRELGLPDGARRLRELTARLKNDALRLDFNLLLSALLPRLIEARCSEDAWTLRHALEDAWRDARVNRCWQRFALQLDEMQAEALLQGFVKAAGTGTRVMLHARDTATEGWALDTRGRVPPSATADRRQRAPATPEAHGVRARIIASRVRIPDGRLPA